MVPESRCPRFVPDAPHCATLLTYRRRIRGTDAYNARREKKLDFGFINFKPNFYARI